MTDTPRRFEVPPEAAGERFDSALTALFNGVTRSRVQQWIEAGQAYLNGAKARKRDIVKAGDVIEVIVPEAAEVVDSPEDIPLAVVYEDEELLVINKPPGLVVHPGAGNARGTLMNALLHRCPSLNVLPRAGIVHRLDKDTSGLLVVAKTERARQGLIAQLQDKTMGRDYLAIVHGVIISGGTVDAPIGRHRTDRKRMAVTNAGKEAVSHYRVLKRYRIHTAIQVSLESGRTHQIRVHMAHLGFPVVGDPVYGGRARVPARADETLMQLIRTFSRQALHALKLQLVHPASGKEMQWAVEVPEDMSRLMKALAADHDAHREGST
jgi:23S rRNA pseudouridine1911/1915/1917 synthase